MPRRRNKTKEPGMVQAKRVVRPEPSLVVTADGYRYEWPEGGEAVDVLEQHRKTVLAVKGAHLVTVEVPDQPVILPAFDTAPPLNITTIPPAEPEPDADLSGVVVPEVDAPESEPLHVATVPADAVEDVTVEPVIGDLWSDTDKALIDWMRRR